MSNMAGVAASSALLPLAPTASPTGSDTGDDDGGGGEDDATRGGASEFGGEPLTTELHERAAVAAAGVSVLVGLLDLAGAATL